MPVPAVDTWTPQMSADETAADFVNRWRTTLPGFCTVPERDNRPGEVCFGGALFAVKAGFKVARRGWLPNGKYVTRQAGYPDGIPINANTADATGIDQGTMCAIAPYLMLCLGPTGSGHPAMFVPWTPATLDVLAADWHVFDRR